MNDPIWESYWKNLPPADKLLLISGPEDDIFFPEAHQHYWKEKWTKHTKSSNTTPTSATNSGQNNVQK
jgi:hypothetical protein